VARLRRPIVIATLLVGGLFLSACGSGSAVSDARASCRHVSRALALQARSGQPGVSKSAAEVLQGEAMSELLKGSAAAAAATSADGSWNALQTTIQESERVPLTNLIPALRRLCQVANSSSPYL
jgi:hypothetical protein